MADNASLNEYQTAVSKLLQADEDQLYEILGARSAAMSRDLSLAGQPDAQVTVAEAQQMGFLDDLLGFGRKVFDNISAGAYRVICGSPDDEDYGEYNKKVKEAFNSGIDKVAAAVAAALVAQLALAPALATVVAAIVMKLFFNGVYQATCDAWKGALPAAGTT